MGNIWNITRVILFLKKNGTTDHELYESNQFGFLKHIAKLLLYANIFHRLMQVPIVAHDVLLLQGFIMCWHDWMADLKMKQKKCLTKKTSGIIY